MPDVWQDIRHGFRVLRHQRSFAAVAILTLALGTGASAAIFSLVDAALLHPLPYPHPEQIVSIDVNTRRDGHEMRLGPSLEDVRAWATNRESLSHIAIERTVFPARVLDMGTPERVESMNVTEEYFPLFGVQPAIGRLFTAGDMQSGAPVALVVSHGFWLSRLGGDRAALPRAVRFDGEPATIVGVLPAGFGRQVPVWRALQVTPDRVSRRGTGWDVLGRVRDGVGFERASAQLASALPRTKASAGETVHLESRLNNVAGEFKTTVTIIGSAVGVILLLACVNVAGLLLARGTSRLPELAIRASLGASRGRIARLVLMESLVLSVAGGAVGLILAWLTLDTVVANVPIELPGDAPARVNGFVLAATAAVATLTALLCGLVPAWRLSRVRETTAMARAGRQHAAALSRRGGQALVAVEVALAVVMLAGTGVMLRSFARLMTVDLGIDPASYMTMSVEPLGREPSASLAYYSQVVEAIRRLPGVAAAGAVDSVPLGDWAMQTSARRPGGGTEMVYLSGVLPGYFEAIGLAPTSGRTVSNEDFAGKRRVVVINAAAAKLLLPGVNPAGQTLQISGNDLYQVIGVVPDVRQWGPRSDVEPQLYYPVAAPAGSKEALVLHVVVRPRAGAPPLVAAMRQAATSAGGPVLVEDVRVGADWLSDRVRRPRQRTVLLSLLGGLGLVLAMVGVLGVTSYAVSRRTQEAGIRVALGARPGQVTRTMLADAIAPIVGGVVVGVGAAMFSTKVIESFLFHTSPNDAWSLVAVAAVLAICACGAAWVPARRASRVDPVTALRAE